MRVSTLPALFIEELRLLFSAGQLLLNALPRMGKAAAAPPLREAFTELLHQTQVHVDRLDKMFVKLGAGPKGSHCYAMEGLITETKEVMGDGTAAAIRDAALLLAGRHLSGYMIARIGCASLLAQRLGHGHSARLLQEMLDDNAAQDAHLIALAGTIIQATAELEVDSR
jgi:ferritin-like metal-binding protein YciE